MTVCEGMLKDVAIKKCYYNEAHYYASLSFSYSLLNNLFFAAGRTAVTSISTLQAGLASLATWKGRTSWQISNFLRLIELIVTGHEASEVHSTLSFFTTN